MSLWTPQKLPEESRPLLEAWRTQPFAVRYRAALAVALRLLTLVFAAAGLGFLALEPTLRTALFVVALWALAVPLAALGYMRKLDRLARGMPQQHLASDPRGGAGATSDARRKSSG